MEVNNGCQSAIFNLIKLEVLESIFPENVYCRYGSYCVFKFSGISYHFDFSRSLQFVNFHFSSVAQL